MRLRSEIRLSIAPITPSPIGFAGSASAQLQQRFKNTNLHGCSLLLFASCTLNQSPNPLPDPLSHLFSTQTWTTWLPSA